MSIYSQAARRLAELLARLAAGGDGPDIVLLDREREGVDAVTGETTGREDRPIPLSGVIAEQDREIDGADLIVDGSIALLLDGRVEVLHNDRIQVDGVGYRLSSVRAVGSRRKPVAYRVVGIQ